MAMNSINTNDLSEMLGKQLNWETDIKLRV